MLVARTEAVKRRFFIEGVSWTVVLFWLRMTEIRIALNFDFLFCVILIRIA